MVYVIITVNWLAMPTRKTSDFVVVLFLVFLPPIHMVILEYVRFLFNDGIRMSTFEIIVITKKDMALRYLNHWREWQKVLGLFSVT